MTVNSSAKSVVLILFAFSDNLSAKNSKLSAESGLPGLSFLECMPNQYAKKYFRSSLMLPKTYPLLSNYSTCLSHDVNLVFELGNAFIGTLVWDSDDGRVSSALLGFFPKLQTFRDQDDLVPPG